MHFSSLFCPIFYLWRVMRKTSYIFQSLTLKPFLDAMKIDQAKREAWILPKRKSGERRVKQSYWRHQKNGK